MTNPSRSLSNGLEAVRMSSLRSERAFMLEKPPTDGSFTQASEPPATIASAFPSRIKLNASIKAWVDEAQAETVP